MSKYVTFEIAKLLKEKGFNEPCDDYYTSKELLNSDGYGDTIFEQGFNSHDYEKMLKFDYSDFNKKQKEDYILCPLISDVVDWLSEKHGIWINVEPECYGENWYVKLMCCSQKTWENLELRSMINKATFSLDEEKSPKEAYLAAIEYTLKNLI